MRLPRRRRQTPNSEGRFFGFSEGLLEREEDLSGISEGKRPEQALQCERKSDETDKSSGRERAPSLLQIEQQANGSHVRTNHPEALESPKLPRSPQESARNGRGGRRLQDLSTHRVFMPSRAAIYVQQFAQAFGAFPPQQRPAWWTLDDVLDKYDGGGRCHWSRSMPSTTRTSPEHEPTLGRAAERWVLTHSRGCSAIRRVADIS